MVIRRGIGILAVTLVLGTWMLAAAAELPEKVKKDLDKATSDYAEGLKAAEKQLLAAFDAETNLVRNQPGLKAEARQEAVEALQVERETFQKHGTIPFSPRMRVAAMTHLRSRSQATRPAAVAYDRAIEQLIAAREDAAAAALVAEKKKVLQPRLAGRLHFTSQDRKNTFTMSLFEDGTTVSDRVTWTISRDRLVINNRRPEAKPPAGGWVDTCVFDGNGQTFRCTNQKGGVHTGKRIDPGSK